MISTRSASGKLVEVVVVLVLECVTAVVETLFGDVVDAVAPVRDLERFDFVLVQDVAQTLLHESCRPKTRQALVPPNPKELLSAKSIFASRASLGM